MVLFASFLDYDIPDLNTMVIYCVWGAVRLADSLDNHSFWLIPSMPWFPSMFLSLGAKELSMVLVDYPISLLEKNYPQKCLMGEEMFLSFHLWSASHILTLLHSPYLSTLCLLYLYSASITVRFKHSIFTKAAIHSVSHVRHFIEKTLSIEFIPTLTKKNVFLVILVQIWAPKMG